MQRRLGNQVPNTFHGPDSRSDLFVSFSVWQFQLFYCQLLYTKNFFS